MVKRLFEWFLSLFRSEPKEATDKEVNEMLLEMNLWQRRQWERDGSPRDIASLRKYLALSKRSKLAGLQ